MPRSTVDPVTFRHLLGAFASGVTVVTARDPGGQPAGMTASAFCSVSLEPPLVLVCVGYASGFHEVLKATPRFGVNVLAADQATLSVRFAGDASTRFTGVALEPDTGDDLPRIGGTTAFLVCETVEVFPGGDHAIFVARVLEGEVSDRPPLLHHQGAYRRLAP